VDCEKNMSRSTGSVTYSSSASRNALTRVASTCGQRVVAVVVSACYNTHVAVLSSSFAVAYCYACANVSSPKFT